MKGSETKLVKFMEGSDKRFVIPVYQRSYSWKEENCKQLFNDLVGVIRSGRRNHFFGSIVSSYDPDGDNEEYLIIDGQQRLTTVSLLFLAMVNLIREGKIVPEDSDLESKIYKKYLIDEYQPRDTRIKLKPVQNDRTAYDMLFQSDEEPIVASNLTTNYSYFYNRIQKGELSPDQLFQAVRSLEIINIKLDADDNPQLIFESLNSTGLDLSEGDKIRNYVLMGLSLREQERLYTQYWEKIENCCTESQIDLFARDYLSIKQQSTPSMNRIYFAFKSYVVDDNVGTEELLRDLLDYARLYRVLTTGNTSDGRLSACIDRLNRLETTVTRPFFMEVLRLNREGRLSVDDTFEVFKITEAYLFRRSVCELPTNQLNKIFLLLHREIMRYDGSADHYLEKLKYALLSKKERARFPDDDEFEEAFGQKAVYLMNPKNRVYIMERFENYGTLEDKDIYRHIDHGDYSIEHIMPQHLTPAWADSLGEDFERIHETWLHRMANLTLTAYNTKYSNNSFAEKRDMENGFRDSGLRMNAWIATQTQWGEAELEERNDLVKQKALTIWAAPITDYRPVERQLDSCTLEDDIDLTGRKIARFAYHAMEQSVNTWQDMLISVVRLLHADDKTVLNRLSSEADSSVDLATLFSKRKEELRSPIEIEDGLYMEGNTSTGTKLNILKKLFDLYRLDASDMVFYLRGEEDDSESEEDAQRYLNRRRYWTFSLPMIREKNQNSGAFRNCNPVKTNWVSGRFGIRGMSLCCVINMDSARCELYFDRISSEENKQIFDELIAHKAEIEGAMGTSLSWDRGERKISSKIYVTLDEIGLMHESEWETIARFHAKWTAKLYEEIVAPSLIPLYGDRA